MSSFHTAAYVIRCDSCGAQLGLCAEHPNAVDTRAALYQRGWRFPTLDIGGHPTQLDLCPGCLAIFSYRKPDQ